ncbi:hypothetical protein DPEC_G00144210 [Dallia pectoralis]|uniref:Uncharacterized protein n=1 Tax=Dallia pectoralis TaxID=75939 RepID=A0ACC2GNR7_DALPE|nr:hypothetical protein DPEC_G00144210 [Dallia pectoralis]
MQSSNAQLIRRHYIGVGEEKTRRKGLLSFTPLPRNKERERGKEGHKERERGHASLETRDCQSSDAGDKVNPRPTEKVKDASSFASMSCGEGWTS